MEIRKDEKTLLNEFRNLRILRKQHEDRVKELEKLEAKAEFELMEYLESVGANQTASYEGLGHATIGKPRLFASCKIDNQEKLFEYLNKEGRAEIIKPTVNPQTLSSFVSELISQGKPIPEFISYYLKTGVKIYD